MDQGTPLYDLFADAENVLQISRSSFAGKEAIQVTVTQIAAIHSVQCIFEFVPGRDWLLVRQAFAIGGPTSNQYQPDAARSVSDSRITKMEEVGGIWAPLEAETTRIRRPPNGSETIQRTITRILEIEFDPPVDDSTFTIPIDSLPVGTEIADGRFGITYRLGDDKILVDGRLHRVSEPITGEVGAQMLKRLIPNSEPLVDPEDRDRLRMLYDVRPRDWWISWATYGFVLAALVCGGNLVWRWRRAI